MLLHVDELINQGKKLNIPWKAFRTEFVSSFKYYPNIEVILTTYKNNNDGNVAVDTAMVGGQVDVLLSFGVANTLARWENNLFVDITDRLKADNLDLVKEWGTETYMQ